MSVNNYVLTTRQRLMNFLGITTVTTTEGNVLDRIINSVTDYIEHYCQRRFKQTTYTNEEYDGTGSKQLLLKNYPVSTTATFTLGERQTSLHSDDWDNVDSSLYFVNITEGIVELPRGKDWRALTSTGESEFNALIRGWRVTYTAGYNYDNTVTFLSDVGLSDLEYIAWRLCAIGWNRRKGDPGVESERIGDYSVSYAKEVFENSEVKAILDKYARMDVV